MKKGKLQESITKALTTVHHLDHDEALDDLIFFQTCITRNTSHHITPSGKATWLISKMENRGISLQSRADPFQGNKFQQ